MVKTELMLSIQAIGYSVLLSFFPDCIYCLVLTYNNLQKQMVCSLFRNNTENIGVIFGEEN
jgi:hypothetical protein